MREFFEKLEPEPSHSAADVMKGVLAGAIGGFIASWAMNHVHGLAESAAKFAASNGEDRSRSRDSSENEPSNDEGQEPATVATAMAVSRRVFRVELTDEQKRAAGPMVHYGYGTAMGALYGGLCEMVPSAGTAAGIPFGALLWLVGDEIAVPLLGLSSPPTKAPPSGHADALAAHAVYGLTADGVRRIVRDGL